MIHLGYTGTRHGMTPSQHLAVTNIVKLLLDADEVTAHHGDCEGGDAQFHGIVHYLRSLGARARIVIHPPIDEKHRAFCQNWDEMRDALTHFARNRAIVNETVPLIAAPFESERQERGGTWMTYDYAIRKKDRTVALVLRNQFDTPDHPSTIQYARFLGLDIRGPGPVWPTRML